MSSLTELEELLKGAKDDAERLSGLLALVDILVDQDFVQAWKTANEALELATKLKDVYASAKAHEALANSLWKLAEYSLSLEHFEQSLKLNTAENNLRGIARCYCGMGIICGINQEYKTALQYFNEGLAASEKAETHELTATLVGNIGHVYFNMGRYTDAMAMFTKALDHYKKIGQIPGSANMLSGMAGVHVFMGEYDLGLQLARESYVLHKKAKHPRGMAVSMMNIGIALQRMGNFDSAEREFQRTLTYCQSINLRNTEIDVLKNLHKLYLQLGRKENAALYHSRYLDGEAEEKKIAIHRKTEQFKQRQEIRQFKKS